MIQYNFRRPPRTVQVTASTILHRGPCLIDAVVVCAAGAAALVNLYDAASTLGDRKLTVAVTNGLTLSPVLGHGIECAVGLYVTVGAATDLTTVTFYPGAYVEDREGEREEE